MLSENEEEEEDSTANIGMNDLMAVLKCLDSKMSKVDKRLQAVEGKLSKVEQAKKKLTTLESAQNMQGNRLNQIAKAAAIDHNVIEDLKGIVIRQDQKIHGLSKKILDMQMRSMKLNLVINGIPEQKVENCKKTGTRLFPSCNEGQ